MYLLSLLVFVVLLAACNHQTVNPSSDQVRERAEASFERLQGETLRRVSDDVTSEYKQEEYLVGIGTADLGKGRTNCRKIAETEALANLAKQIGVTVRSTVTDRASQRAGHFEQDIESTHESMANEFMQDARVVRRNEDSETNICSAVAVLSRLAIANSLRTAVTPLKGQAIPLFWLPDADIAEYDKHITHKSAVLESKERMLAEIEQELSKLASVLDSNERRLKPLVQELETLKVQTHSVRSSLDSAVAAPPEVVDIAKVQELRTLYHAVQEKEKKAEQDHATLRKQTEGDRQREKDLRERKRDLGLEIENLTAALIGLKITKPVIVEGVGECRMHEGITPKACKELALLKAKQDAVEKGGATLIRSLTEVQLNDLKKDEITSESSVKIRQVEVIQPPTLTTDGDIGRYVCRIRATVQNLAQIPNGVGQRDLGHPVRTDPVVRPAPSEPAAPISQLTVVRSGLSETGAFNLAYNDYLNGRYSRALTRFEAFLKEFSGASMTPQVYYWIGESYLALNEDAKAMQSFSKLINDYPNSEMAAPALYKSATAALGKGNVSKANGYYNQLIELYPRSDEARLATNRLNELRRNPRNQ